MAPSLEITGLTNAQRPTALWTTALLQALARDELAGRRPQRLTEPHLATWSRFRGRLTARDLMALLFEDAAVLHRVPFDPVALQAPLSLDHLPVPLAESWLRTLANLDLQAPGPTYIAAQARLLGLPTRMARSDLPVVKAHQRALELPGTGGQLAHHLVSSQNDLTLQGNFTLACGSWQELALAGITALDLAAPHVDFIHPVSAAALSDPNHPLRQRSFDLVMGLHPDKGGLLRVEDQLALWFPNAKFILV